MKKHAALEQLFADFQNARMINQENLKKILSDNCTAKFGKRHGFSDIASEAQYRALVPLTAYEDYQNELEEENAFTVYPVNSILLTSGSTGAQKQFLLTEEALDRYSAAIHIMPYYLTDTQGESLHISVFRDSADKKILLSSAYHFWLRKNGILEEYPFVGGYDLLFNNHMQDVAYVKSWLALSHPDIVSIQSVYVYDALLLFSYLEHHWRTMLADMRSRRISGNLDEKIKELLLQIPISSERLDELESIFSQGFDQPIARKLWKNLRFVGGIGGKVFALQEKALKRFIGDVVICACVYGASECVMGVPVEAGKAQYALMPRCAYYEFYSLSEEKFVSMEELVPGEDYTLAITTFSGLYRYQMSDVLRIKSFIGQSPVIEVQGRLGNMINIDGEKLYESAIRDAVSIWAEQMNVQLEDFGIAPSLEVVPGRYELYAETSHDFDPDLAAKYFDEALRHISADYSDVRDLAMLSMPKVYKIRQGEISASKYADGAREGHNKPRTILSPFQVQYLTERSVQREKEQ